MPPGRFVSGVTQSSEGLLTVIGVCIPWADSRVRGAKMKRKKWEDHRQYLDELSKVLDRKPAEKLIVVGDFNQRIQQGGAVPGDVRMAMQSVLCLTHDNCKCGAGLSGT